MLLAAISNVSYYQEPFMLLYYYVFVKEEVIVLPFTGLEILCV